MDTVTSSYATDYEAPRLLQILRAALAFPRGQYSTNFADLLSPESEARKNYKDGLVALSSMIGSVALIWGLILLLLKIKGSVVGCASGRAFENTILEEQGKIGSNEGSTDLDVMDGSSKQHEGETMEQTSFPSSLCSSDAASQMESVISADSMDDETAMSTESTLLLEGRRAFRTRLVFFIFACMVLASVPLSLAFSFAPMKDTVKSSDDVFQETRDILIQVRAAISSIHNATDDARNILSQTPSNFSEICPNINKNESTQILHVDLGSLSEIISVDFLLLESNITSNMTGIEKILNTIEDSVDTLEFSFQQAEHVIWVIPALLLGISVLTALTTFGVILAWKQDSGVHFQRFMSYGALPILILLSFICWGLAIGSSVSTAISADFCLAGGSHGSPDATVATILAENRAYPNSTTYHFLDAYMSGCVGAEPTLVLVNLEGWAQVEVDNIWRYISTVDALGRADVSGICGSPSLDDLLNGARNIAKVLTKIQRGLDSISNSLKCDRMSPFYYEVVHDNICHVFAEASAWGAVTFTLIGVSTLVMISLRASWRLKITEEKIYHDESEVAENMVVDEHEEYLRYISKYKHEWQEYNGFGTESMRKSAGYSDSEENSDKSDSVSESSISQTTGYTAAQGDEKTDFDDGELTSLGSGDISFPSLVVQPTDEESSQDSNVPPPQPLLLETRKASIAQAEADQNQEVMLFEENNMKAPGTHYLRPTPNVQVVSKKKKTKNAKMPLPIDTTMDLGKKALVDAANANLAPSTSEESTDFSSIGKNAGLVSPTSLYWKQQVGLGIEVAVSSVSDSLALSPNSETSFDLTRTSFDFTKTPSPKKAKKRFNELDHLILDPPYRPAHYKKETDIELQPTMPQPLSESRALQLAATSQDKSKDETGVKFRDDGDRVSQQTSYVEKQVSHFSKASKSNRPNTPTRNRKKLSFDLMRKFDKPDIPQSDDEEI